MTTTNYDNHLIFLWCEFLFVCSQIFVKIIVGFNIDLKLSV